jgi:hypothetical protein
MSDDAAATQLLDLVRVCLRGYDRRQTPRLLRELLHARRLVYRRARVLGRLDEYASYLYLALHAGLDDGDDERVEAAELAYVALTESMMQYPDTRYEGTRYRVFLLYRFADYLADACMEAFMKEYKRTNLLGARVLALDALSRMALADVRCLERDFHERLDADDELNDVANTLSLRGILPSNPATHDALLTSLQAKYHE